jgi:hypothetical protein
MICGVRGRVRPYSMFRAGPSSRPRAELLARLIHYSVSSVDNCLRPEDIVEVRIQQGHKE